MAEHYHYNLARRRGARRPALQGKSPTRKRAVTAKRLRLRRRPAIEATSAHQPTPVHSSANTRIVTGRPKRLASTILAVRRTSRRPGIHQRGNNAKPVHSMRSRASSGPQLRMPTSSRTGTRRPWMSSRAMHRYHRRRSVRRAVSASRQSCTLRCSGLSTRSIRLPAISSSDASQGRCVTRSRGDFSRCNRVDQNAARASGEDLTGTGCISRPHTGRRRQGSWCQAR